MEEDLDKQHPPDYKYTIVGTCCTCACSSQVVEQAIGPNEPIAEFPTLYGCTWCGNCMCWEHTHIIINCMGATLLMCDPCMEQ